MSREYNSVDLPRRASPFDTKEAIEQAILSYSSETEHDIVPYRPKRTAATRPKESKDKDSKLASLSRHNSAAKRSSKKDSRPKLETIESYVEKPVATPTSEEREDAASTLKPSKEEIARHESLGASLGLADLPPEEFTSYSVWNASLSNMRVCPVNLVGGNYFYVENRSFVPQRPGVTLHLGTDKTAPTIAVAHLDYFSTSNLLGLGDPERAPSDVRWEKLHKDSFWIHNRYSFSFEWSDGDMRKYEWHRTKNIYWVQDQGDLVLVEEGKQDVLAQYKGKHLAQVQKQRGNLEVKKMEGERAFAWERMVILSWASIVELQRRRTRERRVSTLFGRVI
jgi:hypothetical protein